MSLLHHAPAFDPASAAEVARDLYGLDVTAAPLPSERDQNFLVTTTAGDRFVLKIANSTDDRSLIEGQTAAMAHVAAATGLCPRVVACRGDAMVGECEGRGGIRHMVRLLTWVPGIPLATVRRHSPALLESLGRGLGAMDAALSTFDHPAIHREFHWDVARAFSILDTHAGRIADRGLRATVEQIASIAGARLGPLLPHLRRSVIYGDANDFNVIVGPGKDVWSRHQQVAGFIDFGDMLHSITAADPAVAMAYAMLDKADPLAAAVAIARGYHATHPLTGDDMGALLGLAQLRLCMSVCLAAWQQEQRPCDPYLAISQEPIARTLPRIAAIPARFAEAAFRQACGLEPVPAFEVLGRWLATQIPAPVLPLDLTRAVVLDLGVGSALIDGDPAANTEPALTARIERAMGDARADAALGRYGEPRLLYASPLFAVDDADGEHRTIHLGVDVFVPPGTPVHAPLDGTIEIATYNSAALDYGTVVVLRHETEARDPFYTLYGHLARRSLEGLRAGERVLAGQPFASIGTPDENGGWTPHLHLQIITDMLDLGADFPGVCRASERELWQAFSPDPGVLLGVGGAVVTAALLDPARALAARRRAVGASLSVGYRQPVQMARGWMQHLFDVTGRRYLDAYNNVPHVGHAHPYVAEAIAAQLRVLNTNTRYLHDGLASYAERLAATLPDPLRVCFFVNSGSEANELALRLARAHTGQRDLIVLEAAYHGNTTALVDISPYKFDGPGGEGRRPWVHVVPLPDVYRGAFKRDDPHAGAKYAAGLGRTIDRVQGEEGRGICGFIAETCPSVAGQIMLPPGYLPRAYRMVRAAGGVCIADEVQTAYGRIGTHFYAFEAHDVVPDIVVLGKPIGNGYPLGAVVTTPEIAASFDNGMEFFSTFGGSTVSCAAGLAVLDVVHAERVQDHALAVGGRLLEGLGGLAERFAIIGDVRGSGLFLGVELVTDRATLEPAAAEVSFIVNRLRDEGILIGIDGPFHNVLKIRPPMPFNLADADRLIETLDRVFQEIVP